MNFTACDGRIVHAFATVCEEKKAFPGNAYFSSDARITHAWMDKELADLEADPTTVNFISKFRDTNYVVVCDAGFVDPKKCIRPRILV